MAPTSIEATGALLQERGPTSVVRQADGSTTAPENAYDETSDGIGDLAGYEGTIEMTYTQLYGGAIENGTHFVTLEYVG